MDIDVGVLSDRGFILLWAINSQLQNAFACLNKWGYTYVDRVRLSSKEKTKKFILFFFLLIQIWLIYS